MCCGGGKEEVCECVMDVKMKRCVDFKMKRYTCECVVDVKMKRYMSVLWMSK